MLYKNPSLVDDKGTDRDDGYKVQTTLEASKETESTDTDEVTIEFDIDTINNNVNKSSIRSYNLNTRKTILKHVNGSSALAVRAEIWLTVYSPS